MTLSNLNICNIYCKKHDRNHFEIIDSTHLEIIGSSHTKITQQSYFYGGKYSTKVT